MLEDIFLRNAGTYHCTISERKSWRNSGRSSWKIHGKYWKKRVIVKSFTGGFLKHLSWIINWSSCRIIFTSIKIKKLDIPQKNQDRFSEGLLERIPEGIRKVILERYSFTIPDGIPGKIMEEFLFSLGNQNKNHDLLTRFFLKYFHGPLLKFLRELI